MKRLSTYCLAVLQCLLMLSGCAQARADRSVAETAAQAGATSLPVPVPVPTFTPTPSAAALSPVPTFTPTSPVLTPVQVTVHFGTYDDAAVHDQGRYHLTRVGSQVRATFTSAASAVAPGTVLLTVPPGYRPAVAVSREVDGWPVAERVVGQGENTRSLRYLRPEVLQPTRFRLQVEPNGEVRHVEGASPAGAEPLAYMLTTTWTTASPPVGEFCTRHPAVQDALRRALVSPGQASPPCSTITDASLAGVKTLVLELGPGHAPLRRRDLAGLGSLQELTLEVPEHQYAWWPADLLAEVPGLQALHLHLVTDVRDLPLALRETLPTLMLVEQARQWDRSPGPDEGFWSGLASSRKLQALLAHTPELRVLTVDGKFWELGPDLLVHTPDLRALDLRGLFGEVPAALLVPVPRLQRLTLGRFDELPPSFLVPTPALEVLSLHFSPYFKYNPYLRVDWPAGFLQPVPALRELHLTSGIPLVLSPDWLDHTPQLEVLTLDVENQPKGGPPAPPLPADLLTRVPQLHTLALKGYGTSPYWPWVRHAGQLRTLTLQRIHGTTIPSDLLQNTPELQSLALHLNDLEELPPDLLKHTPGLQTLTLDLYHLEELPADFLQPIPQLRTLTLDLHALQQMPTVLLQFTPQLRALSLQTWDLKVLPDQWLSPVPQLQNLAIGQTIRTYPSDLLAYTPQLQSLALKGSEYPAFVHRLSQLSSLRSLDLEIAFYEGPLPGDSLRHTPDLQALALRHGGEYLVKNLPTHTPALQSLTLRIETCGPTLWLHDLPYLLTLDLTVGCVLQLAPGWLRFVPRLQALSLNLLVEPGDDLPPDFLLHAPQLQSLFLSPIQLRHDGYRDEDRVQFTLPPDLLWRAPALRQVTSLQSFLVDSLPPQWYE